MDWAIERIRHAVKNSFGQDIMEGQKTLVSDSPRFTTKLRPVTTTTQRLIGDVVYGIDTSKTWGQQFATIIVEVPAFTDPCEQFERADVVLDQGFCVSLRPRILSSEFTPGASGAPGTLTLKIYAYHLANVGDNVYSDDGRPPAAQPGYYATTVDVDVVTSVPSKIKVFYEQCSCGTTSEEGVCGTCAADRTVEFCYRKHGETYFLGSDCMQCEGYSRPYQFTLVVDDPGVWNETLADAAVSLMSQRIPIDNCVCQSSHRVKRDLGILESMQEDMRRTQPFYSMMNPFGYATPGAHSAWKAVQSVFEGHQGGVGVM